MIYEKMYVDQRFADIRNAQIHQPPEESGQYFYLWYESETVVYTELVYRVFEADCAEYDCIEYCGEL